MYSLGASIDDIWEQLHHEFGLGKSTKRTARGTTRHELIATQLELTNPNANFLSNSSRVASPCYAAGELFWYLAGTDCGDQIKAYAPSYQRFLNDKGKADGAYGPRLMSSLSEAISLLEDDPGTCRCYIPIFKASDLVAAHPEEQCKDVPCTTGVSFIKSSSDQLIMLAQMRSNDIWLGLPYDVYCWSSVGHLVADALDTKLEAYIHQATSLHLYDNSVTKFSSSLPTSEIPYQDADGYRPHPKQVPMLHLIQKAVDKELFIRTIGLRRDLNLNDNTALIQEIVLEFGVHTVLSRNLLLCLLNFYSIITAKDIDVFSKYLPLIQLLNAQHIAERKHVKNTINN